VHSCVAEVWGSDNHHCWCVRLVYCPAGFTHDSGSGTCFKLATQDASWSASSSRCHDLHERAHLVVIESQNKQNAVKNYLEGEDQYRRRVSESAGIIGEGLSRPEGPQRGGVLWEGQ